MIELLETSYTFGTDPAEPVASDVALEAGSTEAEAETMLGAAWQQAESFTGKTYRTTTSATVIVKVSQPTVWTWPRYPFPEALTIEAYSQGAWVPWSETYIPSAGLIELEPFTLYRLGHTDNVPGATITAAVKQAVHNLALYQLMQGPSRREFKSQQAGDSGFTREQLMPVLYGSGAGALLAGEVRL
ncbi:hypothetical protein ANTHELSMS3_03424 [Antarctobacter heliothermus]|uniref:Phage gp6-like head-tail connector protein n=1 Tax=Antarctobacter heliothermus TaxID=74033 RepID=A0A222E780_9RHOB|nr:hypothetical protein [Antarctobacter heliothermus]ASP22054.1 hypothetical protein ANTHELSMS3_03424 [Antarctobacter heliothermus]